MSGDDNTTPWRTHGSGRLWTLALAACVVLWASVFDTNRARAQGTLCQAIDAAGGGPVNWPDHENPSSGVFDHVLESPWWFSQAARDYIAGYFAGGQLWGDKGDVRSFNPTNYRVDTPIGRTYNGYANIVYADIDVYDPPVGPKLDRGRSPNDFNYYDTFLKWASAFVHRETFRVNGSCTDSSALATTRYGATRRRDYTTLWKDFYYDVDAVRRASTLVHEVRHAHGEGNARHSGSCPSNSSCDPRWTYKGANTYQMLWLAAYYHTPSDHPYIDQARRDRAEDLFNWVRQNRFGTRPEWILGNFIFINLIPDYYLEYAICSSDPYDVHPCLICC